MPAISPDSIYDFNTLEDIRIAPDGRAVVFTRVSVDKANNRYKRNVWLKDLTSEAAAIPLTNGGKDSAPKWRPDGTWLGFLSGRDGVPAVYALPMRGGEAQPVARHPNGIAEFDWSPDGRRLAFAAALRADEREQEDAATPEAGADKPAAKDDKAPDRFDPRVLTRIPYRTGTAFLEDKFRHLYVAEPPAALGEGELPRPIRVTDGEQNYEGPQWSADGKSLLSATTRDPDSGNLFLWIDGVRIPVPDAGVARSAQDRHPVERLTGPGGTVHAVAPSPDGKWLAMLLRPEDRAMFRRFRAAIMPAAGGALIEVAPTFEGEVAEVCWAADSASLIALAEYRGATHLFRLPLEGGEAVPLTSGSHEIKSFDVAADGRIAFVASTEGDPAVLMARETDGTVRTLYAPNAAVLPAELGKVEPITYDSDGFAIDGWIVTPPGFDPAQRYPLIVNIHGGPHSMWGAATQSMWIELQAMAAAGYVCFFCNPRGSGGYGETSQASILGAWGDGPMRDVLQGIDRVVARGYVDPRRLCVTGGSYGGYLAAWILGHDKRFAAGCAQRGVYNLISFRGTTDIPFFSDMEMGFSPWDDVGKLWDASPLKYAPEIEAPLLLEHSEQDYRVAIEQAEQMFVTLKERRKTVELVRWPREGHELSRAGEPRHRADRIRRIIEWFNRHAAG